MSIFKDNKGREWSIDLNLMTIRPMKLAGFDVYSLEDNRLAKLTQMLHDGGILAEWVWANVKPQAEKLGVGFEEFLSSLGGESLRQMQEAWLAAYLGFTPNPEMRSALGRLLDVNQKMRAEAAAIVSQATDDLETATRAQLQQARDEMTPEKIAAMVQQKSSAPSSVSADSPA